MKFTIFTSIVLTLVLSSCQPTPESNNIVTETIAPTQTLPYFTYQKESLFPGDGSLLRAEDGAMLEDGRIVVVDQAHGLRLIEKMVLIAHLEILDATGFMHNPPIKSQDLME
ncbi:MAG: hypothetical protein R2728_04145 [Chitinophagales bacterium]